MTEQRHDAAKLRGKLLTIHPHRGGDFPIYYVNPDGPDAVAEIERLTAENATLLHELNAMPNQTTNVIFKPIYDQSKSLHNSLIASFDEMDVPETAESANCSDAISRADAITAVWNVLINGERPFSPLYPIAVAINALPAIVVADEW